MPNINILETKETLTQELLNASRQGTEYAKNLGADACKISAVLSKDNKLVLEKDEINLAQSVESKKIGLSVHKDLKKGTASINRTDEKSLQASIAAALEASRFTLADPDLTMATSDIAPKAEPLPFLLQQNTTETSMEELHSYLAEAYALVEKHPKSSNIKLDRCEISHSISFHTLCNSHGVMQSEAQSAISLGVMGMAAEGDEVSGMDYFHRHFFCKENLSGQIQEIMRGFIDKVLQNLHPRKAKPYEGHVLLTPNAVQEILMPVLFYHLSGRQAMDGRSRYQSLSSDKSKGKNLIGQSLFPDWFTVKDAPHDKRMFGATSYDGDGIPTHDNTFIENGVLRQLMFDCYSAKKLGTQTNALAGGPFGCQISEGTDSLENLLMAEDQLLLVDRFSGNINSYDGTFSGVAKSSRLYKKGQLQGSVGETMIAGNIFELKLAGATKTRENVNDQFLSPHILVDGVSVS